MKRILIVGHGSVGKRHVRIVRESLPDATIMVFRHERTTDIPEMANLVTSSMDDVRSFAPQAAIVANPAPFHLGIANALAEMGCHLLIEKPIADKSDDVADFLDTVRAAGVIGQVGYNLRYLPSLSRFRDLINEGLVGKPLSVRCEIGQYLPDWRPNTDYRAGVSARGDLGGGVLLELSHEFDYLRWIFGEMHWLNAWVGNVSDLDVDVEDVAYLNIGFGSNPSEKPVVVNLNMDFVRRDPARLCTVIGELGTLRWNGLTGCVDHFDPGRSNWEQIVSIPHDRDDSYKAQWDHFLSCVESGAQPLVDGDAGLRVLAMVDMARRSAELNGARVFADKKYGL
ncbi:Predicted dehydrogenase [Ectothiorhodosinus mongolicus]|uniref:Predicted dehydrogenase n=1 Tax=Ectothiorhodosinus mongolicus TaxID=233100 RepID=A0A1R3VU08_9GAMM|nr:Predicted dehydrogenase [Ectothiorhodosinus mongolicus]